ncbi:hypothetical protein BC936DRAFT_148450 [Jimgerdemannia flammicorona]|uniref:Uncharacterized protein n=1 Tax=Jimgerdemannia flammicorona TaxID=994334 RepID=A0A433D334_9FUNG|nr:hypothetical protein BC936DRAFT_148450 [Jimgerdemannia flammicorona]
MNCSISQPANSLNYITVLLGHGNYLAIGSQYVFHNDIDNNNTDVLIYHWYDSTFNYYSKLGINCLTWNINCWPIAK